MWVFFYFCKMQCYISLPYYRLAVYASNTVLIYTSIALSNHNYTLYLIYVAHYISYRCVNIFFSLAATVLGSVNSICIFHVYNKIIIVQKYKTNILTLCLYLRMHSLLFRLPHYLLTILNTLLKFGLPSYC